jgi:hypothetical protein
MEGIISSCAASLSPTEPERLFMPRRQRRPVLSTIDAENLYRASLAYRGLLIRGLTDLKPFGPHYSALHDLLEALHKALEEVAGRKIDVRKSDLGLLE